MTSFLSRSLWLILVLVAMVAAGAWFAEAQAAGQDTGQLRLVPDTPDLLAPSKNYDLVHTTLDLYLGLDEGKVEGVARHRVRPLGNDGHTLKMHAADMTIRGVSIEGRSVEFEHEGHDLRIHVGDERPAASEWEVAVQYTARPVLGLWFRRPELSPAWKYAECWTQGQDEENRYWFPSWDYPTDKATFTGIFTVDQGYRVLSNGDLVSQTEGDGTTTFRYELKLPQANYLVMVAAGPYEIHTDEIEGTTLEYWVPPGTGKQLTADAFQATAPSISFFNEWTGFPYPYGKYSQVVVQDFVWGGMENTSAVVLHNRMLVPQSLRAERDSDGLIVHEIAHQWFGDLVTCYGWNHLWLNEGFASYAEYLYYERYETRGDAVEELVNNQDDAITAESTEPRSMVTDFYNRRDAQQSANVYRKGLAVVHMLRHVLGDDGFRRAVDHFLKKHAHDLVTTEDFERACEDATGQTLDWFFDQWVYLAGYPRLSITHSYSEPTGIVTLRVRQTQERSATVPLFRLPLDVEFGRKVGSSVETERHRFWVESDDQSFSVKLGHRPGMIAVDPEGWLLKEMRFERSVEMLVLQAEGASDPAGRIEALRTMGNTLPGSEATALSAARILRDGNAPSIVRREAAKALGKMSGTVARDALVDLISDGDDDIKLRREVAAALGSHRGTRVTRALRDMFRKDPGQHVRGAALTALVAVGADDAEKLCVEALKIRSDREVIAAAAADGLVKLEATDRLDDVWAHTGQQTARKLRDHTIAAIGALVKAKNDPGTSKKYAGRLEFLLNDPIPRIRRWSSAALGVIGHASSVPALERLADTDGVPLVRSTARAALDAIAGGAATDETAELKGQIEDLRRELEEMRSGG